MNKLESAKAIRNLATLYRDMDAAAKALEEIGSLEQAGEEARRATAAAQATLATTNEQLAIAKADLDAARHSAERTVAVANVAASEIQRKAAEDAEMLLTQGKLKADDLVHAARERGKSQLDRLQASEAAIKESIEVQRGTYAGLNVQVAAKRAELQELEGKLAATRDELRKLL